MNVHTGRHALDGKGRVVNVNFRALTQGESGGSTTAAAGTENNNGFSRKAHQAILSRASPNSASMMEMIQKRMITWLSCQPRSSKWW